MPVAWGKPSALTLAAAEYGLLRAGGCIVRGDPHHTWWCPQCQQSFSGPDVEAALAVARRTAAARSAGEW